jgi:Rad3-related DNA helicase
MIGGKFKLLFRPIGMVALTPSFNRTKDWEAYGAIVAKKETVASLIDGLKKGQFDKTIVLANRYDGIDLPDDSCRVLIFDSKPYSESLTDLYQEFCRPDSETTLMRTIRTVEQGMGRSGRGEKDSVVVVRRAKPDRSSRREGTLAWAAIPLLSSL